MFFFFFFIRHLHTPVRRLLFLITFLLLLQLIYIFRDMRSKPPFLFISLISCPVFLKKDSRSPININQTIILICLYGVRVITCYYPSFSRTSHDDRVNASKAERGRGRELKGGTGKGREEIPCHDYPRQGLRNRYTTALCIFELLWEEKREMIFSFVI